MSRLNLAPFENAINRLAEGLDATEKSPADDLLRDGVIQRFEYTYELSWKMLKRYLTSVSAGTEEFEGMTFQQLIRTGSEKGLLLGDWRDWKRYRGARTSTSHLYNQKAAEAVYEVIPGFLKEARHLLKRLQTESGRES